MLKIGCLWMMLSISVTAFAQDTSSDCDKEYYEVWKMDGKSSSDMEGCPTSFDEIVR